MADWILRGGELVDGRGTARYFADIVIYEGRIERIVAPGERVDSGKELDVTGLVVTPGFIDMHAHSDLAVLADRKHLAKVQQGVTLEVVGQDGLGYSPVTDEVMTAMRNQLAGWNGTPNLDYAWRSIADYLMAVDNNGTPVNVAILVPHGAVRMTVMGTSSRPATNDELDRIRDIVADGLRDGAVGMSTGLTYTPGMYASDDELVHALAAVREIGGYYCPHHRNYGARVVEAYEACIDIARRARVPLHLAHCHVSFPQNQLRAKEVLLAVDSAIDDGLDITLDSYPYLAGATYLAALLPSWTQTNGWNAAVRLLVEEGTRSRIVRELEVDGSDGYHGIPIDWSKITISSLAHDTDAWMAGKTISELAVECEKNPADIFLDLLVADGWGIGCLVEIGNESNVREIMLHGSHTVGTDGILVGDRPHPRGWGTFPRFFGEYARDLALMSLEEAVVHATSRPARRLGLTDRGVVAEGFWADLAIFDPKLIASRATYREPTLAPIGVHHVFVNGKPTFLNGKRTGALPGRAVRRTG